MKTKKAIKQKKQVKSANFKNRRLHVRVSLHPVTIFVLLCAGVLMAASTYRTIAAPSTALTMSITALALDDPAEITEPSDGDRFQTSNIKVQGTCPDDSYVKLYKNDSLNGVSICTDGKFEIAVTLNAGPNRLLVKVFNYSDQEGPKSDSLTVFYDPPEPVVLPNSPQQPAPTTKPETVNSPSIQKHRSVVINDLRILTDYNYKVHQSGIPVTLDLGLAGGTPPYAFAIDWNDGQIEPFLRSDTQPFQVSHVYPKESRLYTYIIKIAVSDANGNQNYIQTVAVVNGSQPTEAAGSVSPQNNIGGIAQKFESWQIFVWPAYILIVLMVLSFYLGEREERRILLRRRNKLHYR